MGRAEGAPRTPLLLRRRHRADAIRTLHPLD
jgi:hypothetical protein